MNKHIKPLCSTEGTKKQTCCGAICPTPKCKIPQQGWDRWPAILELYVQRAAM